jgi:hypothetical protein
VERRAREYLEEQAKLERERKEREAGVAINVEDEQVIQAETSDLSEQVAQHFESKLDGSSFNPDTPEDLIEGQRDNEAGRTIRTRWMEDLMLQKPGLTSTDIQAAMQAVFGIGINSEIVSEALKTVRELHGMRYISRRRADPLLHDTYLAAQAVPRKPPDPNSPRLIEYLVGSEVRYEYSTLGTLQDTIDRLSKTQHILRDAVVQVWKLTKTSVRWLPRIEEEEES